MPLAPAAGPLPWQALPRRVSPRSQSDRRRWEHGTAFPETTLTAGGPAYPKR